MSDFDKEAEREKLREKYERDQADREATQRMSDLLLKGATMTNTHCGTCGDPFFQQDGVTFCPSCHGGPEGVEGPTLEEEQPSVENTAEPAETNAESAETADAADETPSSTELDVKTPSASESVDSAAGRPSGTTDPARSNRRQDSGVNPTPPASRPTAPAQAPAGDLEAARAALVASLEHFAREAAETDDPRYATECLEAAREAGEALTAIR